MRSTDERLSVESFASQPLYKMPENHLFSIFRTDDGFGKFSKLFKNIELLIADILGHL